MQHVSVREHNIMVRDTTRESTRIRFAQGVKLRRCRERALYMVYSKGSLRILIDEGARLKGYSVVATNPEEKNAKILYRR